MSRTAILTEVRQLSACGYLLRLSYEQREETLRVSEEAYRAAGAPMTGDTLYEEELRLLTHQRDCKRAYERAVKILGAGDNTARTLQRKLRERGFSEEASAYAVSRLTEEGYLKENEMLLRQLAIFAKRMWGKGKFLPALLAKGFSREEIEAALLQAEEEGVYRACEVKEALLTRYAPKDEAERRALLYKNGFRP